MYLQRIGGKNPTSIWSHDGARMLFRRSRVNLIVEVNRDSTNQTLQQLPSLESGNTFVAWDWSRDGNKLIGTDLKGQVVYFSFETNRYEKVVDEGSLPMWLADSSRFIFTVEGKAYLGDILTKRVREILTLPDTSIRSVNISRDDQLLYFTLSSNESDIWLLDLP